MPSIYDFHHIELDKVGRGKKRISLDSPDGGIKDVLFSPVNSRPASRRNSRTEDTKSRLFNQTPQQDSQRGRVVKNLLKSNIFLLDQPVTPQKSVAVAQAKSKSVFTPERRNPITGGTEKQSAVTNGGMKSKQFTPARIQATLGSTASTCTPSIASSSLSLDSSSLSSLPSN